MELESFNNIEVIKPYHKYSRIINIIYFIVCLSYISTIIWAIGIYRYFYELAQYLTNWGYMMNFIYSIIKIKRKRNNKLMNIYFNVCFNIEFIVCFVYWVFIFQYMEFNKIGLFQSVMANLVHLFPLIFILLEYFIDKSIKFEYKNYLYISIFFLIYGSVDFIFIYIFKDAPYPIEFKIKLFWMLWVLIFSIIFHIWFTYLKKKFLIKN